MEIYFKKRKNEKTLLHCISLTITVVFLIPKNLTRVFTGKTDNRCTHVFSLFSFPSTGTKLLLKICEKRYPFEGLLKIMANKVVKIKSTLMTHQIKWHP